MEEWSSFKLKKNQSNEKVQKNEKKKQSQAKIRRKYIQDLLNQKRSKASIPINLEYQNNYFSGQQKSYESELEILYQDLNESIQEQNFDNIYEILYSLHANLQQDCNLVVIKTPKIIQSGLLAVFRDLLLQRYDQLYLQVNIILEILIYLTLGSENQNYQIYNVVLEDSLLKYFSSINSNIIDSALHLAAHFLSDAGIPARCLLREGIINNVVEVYKFKRLEKQQQNPKYFETFAWVLACISYQDCLNGSQVLELNEVAQDFFAFRNDELCYKYLLHYFINTIRLQKGFRAECQKKILDILTFDYSKKNLIQLALELACKFTNQNIDTSVIQSNIFNTFYDLISYQNEKITALVLENIVNYPIEQIYERQMLAKIQTCVESTNIKIRENGIICLSILQQNTDLNCYIPDIYDLLNIHLSIATHKDTIICILDAFSESINRKNNQETKREILDYLKSVNFFEKLDLLLENGCEQIQEKIVEFSQNL